MRRLLSLTTIAVLVALAFPASVAGFSQQTACGTFRISSGTIEMAPGYWAEGVHTTSIRFLQSEVWGPWEFTVDPNAPLYRGQVWIAAGLITQGLNAVPDQTINPAQDTVFWASWLWDMTGAWGGDPYTMQQAKADLESIQPSIEFSWDGGPWVAARQGPITDACANGFVRLVGLDPHSKALFMRHFGPK